MDLELRGRRALVTGGSRGIGLQIARVLVAEGADVAVAARDPRRLAAAETELSPLAEAGTGRGRIVTAQVDTGDDASVRAAAVTERTPDLVHEAADRWQVDTAEARRRLAAGTAIGRQVTAQEVAWVVAFLASPRSVAVTGDPVVVSGGTVGAIHY